MDKFKMTRKPTDKEIRDRARKQFIKNKEFCEHNPNFPCDECLDKAIALAKAQTAKMNVTQKNKIVEQGQKDGIL